MSNDKKDGEQLGQHELRELLLPEMDLEDPSVAGRIELDPEPQELILQTEETTLEDALGPQGPVEEVPEIVPPRMELPDDGSERVRFMHALGSEREGQTMAGEEGGIPEASTPQAEAYTQEERTQSEKEWGQRFGEKALSLYEAAQKRWRNREIFWTDDRKEKARELGGALRSVLPVTGQYVSGRRVKGKQLGDYRVPGTRVKLGDELRPIAYLRGKLSGMSSLGGRKDKAETEEKPQPVTIDEKIADLRANGTSIRDRRRLDSLMATRERLKYRDSNRKALQQGTREYVRAR